MRQAGESESTAEWIVDITTLADREGRAMEFADGYSQSQLRQQNEQQLNKCLAHGPGQVHVLLAVQLVFHATLVLSCPDFNIHLPQQEGWWSTVCA